MDRRVAARNVTIIVLIALAVWLLPQGGRAADTFGSVLSVAFGVAIAYFLVFMYRQQHLTLYGLGDRMRSLLYGALAVAAVVLAAKVRMWQTGLGEAIWFALLAGVVYVLVLAWRRARL